MAMRFGGLSTVLCALVSVLGGCDAPEYEDGDVEFRDEVDNGIALNGTAFNGFQLNGFQLNGFQLNGFQLNGFQLNGFQLNGVTLTGSSFKGTLPNNQVKSGLGMVGAEIHLTTDSKQYTLRIDAISPSTKYPDVLHHMISVRDDAIGTWSPLCADEQGNPVAAIPVQNYWDATSGARVDSPSAVTLACRNAAIGKCVDWGYRPWATVDATLLRDHHQACTRMVRADYCGVGRSYTFNGTPIDIFDKVAPQNIQIRATTTKSDWKIEAEWGPNGAVCVGDSLRLKMFDDRGLSYAFPSCLDAIDDIPKCGDLAKPRNGKVANAYCDKWESDFEACAGADGFKGDDKP